MGTRADFYLGTGLEAEWLGSVAWDGYPGEYGIPASILDATDKDKYLTAVDFFLTSRDDATYPRHGWPWPWENSRVTDYAYAFVDEQVLISCFGSLYMPVPAFVALSEDELEALPRDVEVFPDMSAIQRVDLGKRSGLIILRR